MINEWHSPVNFQVSQIGGRQSRTFRTVHAAVALIPPRAIRTADSGQASTQRFGFLLQNRPSLLLLLDGRATFGVRIVRRRRRRLFGIFADGRRFIFICLHVGRALLQGGQELGAVYRRDGFAVRISSLYLRAEKIFTELHRVRA